jgi:hypothetical protein
MSFGSRERERDRTLSYWKRDLGTHLMHRVSSDPDDEGSSTLSMRLRARP